jgi:hypothetical protein
MIVCDCCKSTERGATEYKAVLIGPKATARPRRRGPGRGKQTVIGTVHLCEGCIAEVGERFGELVRGLHEPAFDGQAEVEAEATA